MDKEIYNKITQKKEFSQLPREDVEKCWMVFEKRQVSNLEKIRLTRDLLRKVFSVFSSNKLLKIKEKSPEWVLKKHISTKERYEFYEELYKKLIGKFKKNLIVFDLGCGINGFSYEFFPKKIKYVGIESMGQLVDFQNYYFKKNNLNGHVIHESLFNLDAIKKLISNEKREKIIFLFKVIDSLEMVEKNYSKKLLETISSFADKIILSFATRSLVKKSKFKATRNWIYYFIKNTFEILEDFDLGNERYLVFRNK